MQRESSEFFHSSSLEMEKDLYRTKLSENDFYVIRDNYQTLHDITMSIKEAGIEECGLIFGIDYTMSNRLQGQRTFAGRSLHDTSGPQMNPYQQVICTLGETLEELDDDGEIPAFGFGDSKSKEKSIFSLKAEGVCKGFNEVLDVYNKVTPTLQLSGPTNFVPLIEEAVETVKKTRKYHILVIIADGQVTDEKINEEVIVEASNWPLSIVVIGVGDGPWETMRSFDDGLPERKFDNFQFVDFHDTVTGAKNPCAALALRALMEIPEQYEIIKNHELLKKE